MEFASGSSLVIRGYQELDLMEINKNLKLEPARFHRKGDVFSKSSSEIQNDVWIYEIKMKSN